MGPRRFRRGCRAERSSSASNSVSLQWGRDVSVADVQCFDGCGWQDIAQASMGPRRFRRGCLAALAPAVEPIFASMGPRRFRRGCVHLEDVRVLRRPFRFNGAATFPSRMSTVFSPSTSTSRVSRFNGAATFPSRM